MRLLDVLLARFDRARFGLWAWWDARPNGSHRLQAIHQAVLDTTDSLEAVSQAIDDDDIDEAKRLLVLAHFSLTDHLDELKGLL